MKRLNFFSITLLALLFGFSACSSVTDSDNESQITEEDLEIAAEIVGESLSDQNSGALSSMYDALSSVGQQGIRYGGPRKMNQSELGYQLTRGNERDYEYSYDPETGIHSINFTRSVERPNFSKSVTAALEYIFSDPEGTFVVFPRANPDSIETIDFSGVREGTSEGPRFETEFVRTEDFFFEGLHESSSEFRMSGLHESQGTRIRKPENRPEIESTYDISIEFVDISIDKEIVEQNGNLEEGVTGTVNYSLVFSATNGDQDRDRVVEGTVEFMADGTGLMRFARFAKVFRISLSDGDAQEQ
ncbi:MAG: hypothetical protein GVY02_01045 [Bacteroidetes bacterium]|jgi:hypothetical protein|nr:hypothetical protein [Bacteroidota bacterium]